MVMYVEGAVAQCTATADDDGASGWTLEFRDAAGAYVLDSMPANLAVPTTDIKRSSR
jgi:hypothetical protein